MVVEIKVSSKHIFGWELNSRVSLEKPLEFDSHVENPHSEARPEQTEEAGYRLPGRKPEQIPFPNIS